MTTAPTSDPLDDPAYLRTESERLREIITTLSDPEIKHALAVHSQHLAQRAAVIAPLGEDPDAIRVNVERCRARSDSGLLEPRRRTVDDLSDRARQALDGPQTLRDLATWYRDFAERTDNPAIWEARVRMAEDLEAEADRLLHSQAADRLRRLAPVAAAERAD
jgi:hypothetical protein